MRVSGHIALIVALVALGAGGAQDSTPRVSFHERLLVTTDAGARVSHVTFAPDGESVAYLMHKAGKEVVVVGAEKGEEFDDIGPRGPVHSPDGKVVAYTARLGGKELVVVGRTKGPLFDDVQGFVFSPDSKVVAYNAGQGEKWFVVVGDREGPEFDEAGWPAFSPDGGVVAYAAKDEGTWFIVTGEKKGKRFDNVSHPKFSPDGTRIAYEARMSNGKWVVIEGDEKSEEFDETAELCFLPDGKGVVYRARKGDRWFAVKGKERASSEWDDIRGVIVSGDGTVAYRAKKDGKWFAVVGEKKGEAFDDIRWLRFHPDGKSVGFPAWKERHQKMFMVVGDRRGAEFEDVMPPAFSPDGKAFAYMVEERGKQFVVVGDRVGERYDYVSEPTFSRDGKKVAYGARKGRELWWKVVDVPLPALQEVSAEETFRKIEDAILAAKTVRVKLKWEAQQKGESKPQMRAEALLLVKKENKIFASQEMQLNKEKVSKKQISDGKTMAVWLGERREYKKLLKHDGAKALTGVVRATYFQAQMMRTTLVPLDGGDPGNIDPRDLIPLCEFAFGPNDGDARTIVYKFSDAKHVSNRLTYDPKTLKPLKHVLEFTGEDAGTSTETYEEFVLDEEIPDDKFVLPPEK